MPLKLIIGGGFAGLAAAYWLKRQREKETVVLLERGRSPLNWMKRKGLAEVPVCTIAAESADKEASYPGGSSFAAGLCAGWSGGSTYDWLSSLGLPLRRDEDGSVYTDEPGTFRRGLMQAVLNEGVRIEPDFAVETISPQGEEGYRIWSREGQTEKAQSLLLATGGERNHGRVLARDLGMQVRDPVAAFVRLRPVSPKLGEALSVHGREVRMRCPKTGAEALGRMQFSGRGLEGPALSLLSSRLVESWKQRGWKVTLEIDWIPRSAPAEIRQKLLDRCQSNRRNLIGHNPMFGFTEKQWRVFLNLSRIDPETPWLRLKTRKLNTLVQRLKVHAVSFSGMGLPSGERAWRGGVQTDQLDPRSLSFAERKGLYVAGELLDVLGQPGGRHLNLVWASGHLAGSAMGLAGGSR